jgi:hypothetical protein
MRSRGLSFADAVKLLDGDSPLVTALGQAAGLGAAAVTVGSAGSIDFFALRDQVVAWGQSAVKQLRSRVQGLGRYDRTARLAAANSVLVVVSFYEALDEWLAGQGLRLSDAKLTAGEQVAVAGGAGVTESYRSMIDSLVRYPMPAPSPQRPFEQYELDLLAHYNRVAVPAGAFLRGLHAFEHLAADLRSIDLADRALTRYQDAYRRLAAEIPEFRIWSEMLDAQATRLLIGDVLDALRRTGPAGAAVADLAKVYTARLRKPILRATDAPDGLVLPTLAEGYIDPSGWVAVAGPKDLPTTERWWADARETPDVQAFLLAFLSGAEATERPLMVLGQPGSGKSVLTRRLAARLAETDFLPVRVVLRTTQPDAPIHRQIEQAVYQEIHREVSWPELVAEAGTALPVVMMDGFDELLQATGQDWANYLERLQDFQQREAELGRPVAVLVTSRIVVADRVRFPSGTAVVRLAPFTDDQIDDWLGTWNGLNAAEFAARGLRPLRPEAVLAHRELAEQPLLLLLLALYDGQANHLQTLDEGLGRTELYERLFTNFFERQVGKFGDELSADQRAAEVAREWRQLSAVAVAMYNRGLDTITEDELDADLRHLLADGDRAAEPGGTPVRPARMLVGRFFFVHEARASTSAGVASSFEFLHATFGEFLAARRIVTALTELDEDQAYLRTRPGNPLNAGFFHALTSFVSITRRAPLWEFCRALLGRLPAEKRASCRRLVLDLLPAAGFTPATWSLLSYGAGRRTAAARQAAFSANLVCLAVLLSDGPVDVAEIVGEPVVVNWRRQALLWMSQLDLEDSRRLWQSLRVAWDLDSTPTRLMVRLEDGAAVSVLESLPWPPEERPAVVDIGTMREADAVLPAESTSGRKLRKSGFVQTGFDTRELIHVLIPFWRRFGDIRFIDFDVIMDSDAHLLFDAVLADVVRSDAAPSDAGEVAADRERFARGVVSALEAITESRRPADVAEQAEMAVRLRDDEGVLESQRPVMSALANLLFEGGLRINLSGITFTAREDFEAG